VFLGLVAGVGAGCQHQVFEPTPLPILRDEVYLRNAYFPERFCEIYVLQANAESVVRSEWSNPWPHLYPVKLPAGRSRLDVRVKIYDDEDFGGWLEGWEVDLPGGREYEIVGFFSYDQVEVWIEDRETHEPVTERRAIAITLTFSEPS
jgi:hypothetical protein